MFQNMIMSSFLVSVIFVLLFFCSETQSGSMNESLNKHDITEVSVDVQHNMYFNHDGDQPIALKETASASTNPPTLVKKDDGTHGSCFLSLNSSGQVHQKCIDKLKSTDMTLKDIDINVDPEKVQPNDIGMFCNIWIKMAVCLINSTCDACSDEGALVESFIKEETRKLYDRKCGNTSVTFEPLQAVLCDVTVSTKTGLIISIVVLSIVLTFQCILTCLLVSRGKKAENKGEKEKETQTSAMKNSSSKVKSAKSKQNPGKPQKLSKVGK